jgi:hypothetical protein
MLNLMNTHITIEYIPPRQIPWNPNIDWSAVVHKLISEHEFNNTITYYTGKRAVVSGVLGIYPGKDGEVFGALWKRHRNPLPESSTLTKAEMTREERNRLCQAIRSTNFEDEIEFREETLSRPLAKGEYIDVSEQYYYTAERSEESWAHAVSFHKNKEEYSWFDSSRTTNVKNLSDVQQLKRCVSDRGTEREINDDDNLVALCIVYFVNHSTT